MGPFISNKNTKHNIELSIILSSIILILFSIYRSFKSYDLICLKTFYPILLYIITIITSLITSFIYSLITKTKIKNNINIIPNILFCLMLGINVPIYLLAIGNILITILTKKLKFKNINVPILVGLIIIFISSLLLKIDLYKLPNDINIELSNINNIGTYESLITPYNGISTYLFGNFSSIIASSLIGCIICAFYLLIKKSIKWKILLSSFFTIFLITFYIGNINDFGLWYSIYMLATIGVYGIILASINENSPVTPIGQILYGIFIGILTIFIRYIFGINEAIFISIFIMGLFINILDRVGAKARFHFNKCLFLFTFAWILVIFICIFMTLKLNKVSDFNIVSKNVNKEITEYIVTNTNNIGTIKVNLVVNNNEITKFDIIESSDENVYKLDQIFIENITKNPSSLDDIDNINGYDDTCNSLKNVVKNVMKDYKIYENEENFKILSNNYVDYKYIYIAVNYDIKAKVVFRYQRIYDIEIIDISNENDITDSYITSIISNQNDLENISCKSLKEKQLLELVKNVKEVYLKEE